MKKLIYVFVILLFSFSFMIEVKADYKTSVLNNKGATCNLHKNSTGYCLYKNSNLNSYVSGVIWLDTGDEVTILTSYPKIESKNKALCPGKYQYVSRQRTNGKTYYGYYCDTYLYSGNVSDDLKNNFKNAGFPESYWSKLAVMKEAHPNWNFKAINLGIDFNTAVKNESIIGRSLMQVTTNVNDVGYLNTNEGSYNYYTDKYNALDGTTWYAANYATVAYYMDPRNFLSDMHVFQFEGLSFDSSLSDDLYKNSINTIFSGDYLSRYSNDFLSAGKESKVNPIYLASLSSQEVSNGATAGTAISGLYNGMYNFYNIGATSGTNAVYKGLNWAAKTDSYSLRPWNTPYKSIVGGAKWIGKNYINIGQNTIYFKKWDVVSNVNKDSGENYVHQYQTNIEAPAQEGLSTYKAKNKSNILDLSYTFYIPIYNNMPQETKLPNKGNQNNYLKSLTIDGNKVADFDGAISNYNYYTSNTNISISAEKVAQTSNVSGLGSYDVSNNKSVNVTVTAQNGSVKTYVINIVYQAPSKPITDDSSVQDVLNEAGIKNGTYITGLSVGSDISILKTKIANVKSNAKVTLLSSDGSIKNSGIVKTGDKVKVELPKETKTYEIVIYGDVNGDGKISASDYVKIKNHIMDVSHLSGVYKSASDVNKDGKISASDYVKIKNYIMNTGIIEQ